MAKAFAARGGCGIHRGASSVCNDGRGAVGTARVVPIISSLQRFDAALCHLNSLHRSITLSSRTTGWNYRHTVAAGQRLSVHFARSGIFRYGVAQIPAMSGTVVVLSH